MQFELSVGTSYLFVAIQHWSHLAMILVVWVIAGVFKALVDEYLYRGE